MPKRRSRRRLKATPGFADRGRADEIVKGGADQDREDQRAEASSFPEARRSQIGRCGDRRGHQQPWEHGEGVCPMQAAFRRALAACAWVARSAFETDVRQGWVICWAPLNCPTNIDALDRSIQQIILVKSIDFIIGSGSAPAAIGRNALVGNPHSLGQLAGLPEHVDRNAAARIPVAADAQAISA